MASQDVTPRGISGTPAIPATEHTGVSIAETELHAGALSFPQVLAQGLAQIAPAYSFLLGGTFIATQAGYSMPLVYVPGAILCLAIGITLAILAREYPSAGGYFTYISKGLHPRLGFLVAWTYFLYSPLIGVAGTGILGFLLESELKTRWGIALPWWVTSIVIMAACTWIVWHGIKISGRVLLVLAFIELAILLLFGVSGILNPGPGGLTLKPFTADPAFGISGLALGVVFVIFAFTGFEAVVPIAEETRNPRRTVPMAIIVSVVIVGVFFLVATFGLVTGWGVDTFDKGFGGQPVGAFFTLGERLWGPGWVLLLLVLINSGFGLALACTIVTNRLFFSLGRAGVLPRWFAQIDHRVPRHAVIATAVLMILWGLIVGFWLGSDQSYFWTALIVTLACILIYGSGAVAVFWHWARARRSEFHWFWHFVVPVAAVFALVVTTYYSLQGLAGVFQWAPVLVAGWVVAGICVLVFFRVTRREDWLLNATKFVMEHEATEAELQALEDEP